MYRHCPPPSPQLPLPRCGATCGRLCPVFGHGKRRLDPRPVGARPVRALAEHLAERAPAALAVEQAEQVTGDVLEEDSPRQLAFHVRPQRAQQLAARAQLPAEPGRVERSEEHTSELRSLMRISYAVFCLKKKTNTIVTQ